MHNNSIKLLISLFPHYDGKHLWLWKIPTQTQPFTSSFLPYLSFVTSRILHHDSSTASTYTTTTSPSCCMTSPTHTTTVWRHPPHTHQQHHHPCRQNPKFEATRHRLKWPPPPPLHCFQKVEIVVHLNTHHHHVRAVEIRWIHPKCPGIKSNTSTLDTNL